ncbi:MAG TPA: Ig-like domain-containing protein [Opitutaceae bacterium]
MSLSLLISAHAASFYVDALAGNDANDGSSPATAWRTAGRINQTRLLPGDQVLFSRGQAHVGNLILSAEDSGTAAAPVVIGSYGDGRATLYTPAGDGILLSNTSYVIISGLDVAGPGWNAANDGSRGIVLTGDTHHCIVEHLTASGFHKAGVRLENLTHENAVTFVTAEHNGYIGLHVSGDYQLVSDCRALYNHGDLTVTNNWSGSGILVDDASYVTVEYSEAAYNGDSQPWTGNGPVGIWCWNADHITFRHCISHHNTRGKGNADGGGFDLDGGTTHSLIEYCYSYNNTGPGFMVYNFKWQNIPNRNNVIRYCVSENDAQGGIFIGTTGVALENIEVHNVTAFNTNGARVLYNSSGTKKNVNLRNNIFVTTGKLTISGSGITLQGNCYYSSSGSYSFGSYGGDFAAWTAATGAERLNGALVGLQTDPQLVDVGNGTKLTNPRHLSTLRSYSPASATAPVIDAGLDLPGLFGLDAGSNDLVGAAVPIGAYDMGAFEFRPAAIPDVTPPTVAVASPLADATVANLILVAADVADETAGSGVSGVRIQLDGVDLGDEVTVAPYSLLWDTTTAANGLHTLTVIARDFAGNVASASVTVTVDNAPVPPPPPTDTTAPSIAITAPGDGATVSGWFTLSADVADETDGSGVAGVQFQLDGLDLGQELAATPYSLPWDTTTAANGLHTLTVIARDFAGNVASASVTIAVDNRSLNLDPIIKDNADASGVEISSGWSASASVAGFYGTNYLSTGAGNKSVRYIPAIPRTGSYDVYVRWTSHTNRASNAPIDVIHAGGTTTFSVNMRSSGGTWVLLGTFSFDAGETGSVRLRADGANGYVVADAVQFIPH